MTYLKINQVRKFFSSSSMHFTIYQLIVVAVRTMMIMCLLFLFVFVCKNRSIRSSKRKKKTEKVCMTISKNNFEIKKFLYDFHRKKKNEKIFFKNSSFMHACFLFVFFSPQECLEKFLAFCLQRIKKKLQCFFAHKFFTSDCMMTNAIRKIYIFKTNALPKHQMNWRL